MPVLGIAWPEKSLTLFLFISRLARSSFVRQLSGMQRTFSVRVKVVKRPSFYLDIFFSQRWQSSALRKFFLWPAVLRESFFDHASKQNGVFRRSASMHAQSSAPGEG